MALALRRLGPWIARVPEALAVAAPGKRAAAGRILDAIDRRLDLPDRRDVVDVERAVLAAVLRQRDRELRAVRRGDVPVDRGVAGRIDDIRIDQRLGRFRIGLPVHQHERRLLLGGIVVDREDMRAGRLEIAISGRAPFDQPCELGGDGGAAGQRVEIGAGARILRVAPRLDLGIGPVFERAIGIGHLDALDRVDGIASGPDGRRPELRGRRGGDGGAGEQRHSKHQVLHITFLTQARHADESRHPFALRPKKQAEHGWIPAFVG